MPCPRGSYPYKYSTNKSNVRPTAGSTVKRKKRGIPVTAVPFVLPSLWGLALLLAGMKIMETALRNWAGSRLADALERLTRTPFRGFVTGTVTSALMQSSTAVTVLTIGLVNARLMTFSRSLGIILGTNVGTCLTTELMSLHLHRYGTALLAAASSLWLWTALSAEMALLPPLRRRTFIPLRYGAAALAGFSLLLVGFRVLQSIGPHLKDNGTMSAVMAQAAAHPLWGVAGGAALAALVHSSAAVIGMAMGLAASGAMPVETGIAVVLGANVGTCFTGLVAALGGSRGGRFVALAQLALNAGGVLLFYPFIGALLDVSALLAPNRPYGQIAHAQTIFNVVCSLLALPLASLPAWRRLDAARPPGADRPPGG